MGREGKEERKSTEIEEGKRTRERLKEGLEGERESEGKRKKRGGEGEGEEGDRGKQIQCIIINVYV